MAGWPSGKSINAIWPASSGIQHRPAYRYNAWIPPFIAETTPIVTGTALVALTQAESQCTALKPAVSPVTDAFVRIEALSSSRIEGLILGHKPLALALAEIPGSTSTAKAVAKNVYAMKRAVELATKEEFNIELIRDIHATLCAGTQLDSIAGEIRTTQNWIGKGQSGPGSQDYVPPPPELVKELLEDLCRFANRTDLPVVFQMAVAHAQFELIHPFGDGNGRVGRCLTQAVLARRLGPDIIQPPISSVLAADPHLYISSLQEYRKGKLDSYILIFSTAVVASVAHLHDLTNLFSSLQQQWIQRLESPRSGSLLRKAVAILPGSPVVDAARMSWLLQVDSSPAIRTLNRLGNAGILTQVTSGKRNRLWIASEIIEILDTYDFSARSRNHPGDPALGLIYNTTVIPGAPENFSIT